MVEAWTGYSEGVTEISKHVGKGTGIHKGLWDLMLLSKSSVNSKGLDKDHEELLNVSTGKADVLRAAFASMSWTVCLEARLEQAKSYQQ